MNSHYFSIIFLILTALLSVVQSAQHGVDISTAVTESNFACMKTKGYTYVIVRAYRSSGSVDTNAVPNIQAASAAGLSPIGAYMFPCYSCGNPAQQMTDTITALTSSGVTLLRTEDWNPTNRTLLEEQRTRERQATSTSLIVNKIWLDIEGTSYWSSNTEDNVDFITTLISTAKASGVALGMYTSESQWQPITGDSSCCSSLPLW